jgi:hypothetical protein
VPFTLAGKFYRTRVDDVKEVATRVGPSAP